MDRRQALLRGEEIPTRVQGAALFADVSGFTPLTEALSRELGPQQGAEELTSHLNRVFDALIMELHRFGGSVIGFSGDAITCWLNGDDGQRATACALAMQRAISLVGQIISPSEETIQLAMKAAVSVGPVRRFLIGDPQIQIMDVLTGSTIDNLAAAEQQANRGEVVLTPSAAAALRDFLAISMWRESSETRQRFAVVDGLTIPVAEAPWPELPAGQLTEGQIRPWLLPPVYERLHSGQGEFLAELRPAASLFIRFGGIDYDHDEQAGEKLIVFVRQVQRILTRYESSLLHVTFGDKGSYLAAAIGAPIAHEDDAFRAASAALAIRSMSSTLDYIGELQIGINTGYLRTGAYGGTLRRTYGVMGDSVNLAARLMQAANPGQILASQGIHLATQESLDWEILPPIKVKGKREAVSISRLLGPKEQQTNRLQEARYKLPMVGRKRELGTIQQKLSDTLQGEGQIVAVIGEAGIGKSRLIAEVLSLAESQQFDGYGGECQSHAATTSYSAWQNIWRSFFKLDPVNSLQQQITDLQNTLSGIDPALEPRLPLLGPVVNLSIPDNDLTQTFDAKLRKESLESLLVDCLRARTRARPTLIVLEDCHWIDPLSNELLSAIGRAIANMPVLLLLSYRPPEIYRSAELQVSQLFNNSEVNLLDFTQDEAEHLIRLKVNQIYGRDVNVSKELVTYVNERAEGNPFYIEELLNYLQDHGVELDAIMALRDIELPTSLHSLILSRIDQLTERQKGTIKVASVIGRTFTAATLWGAYPQLGQAAQVRKDLDELSRLDMTPLDRPEPELTYLFKSIVTQEVAYENLPHATRASLHETVAHYIEDNLQTAPDQFVDLLAFHYARTTNEDKKRQYLLKAGEIAQSNYANETAVSYYQRVIPLLPESEQISVMVKLGNVLSLIGDWQKARDLYNEALLISGRLNDLQGSAAGQLAIAILLRNQGQFDDADAWFGRSRSNYEEINDSPGIGRVLQERGTLAAQRGNTADAQKMWNESLIICRQLGDDRSISALLSNLGILARWKGDYESARRLYEESLEIRRELGDRWGIAVSLANLGYLALHLGDLETARHRLDETVNINREVGDRRNLANSLNELANVNRAEENYPAAEELYRESLLIYQDLGDLRALAYLLEDFGSMAVVMGDGARAMQLYGAAFALRERIGAPLPEADQEKLEIYLNQARQALSEDDQSVAYKLGVSLSLERAVQLALARA